VELGKFDEPVAWFWERCFFMSELPLKITNRIERQLGNWPGVTSFLHKLCISDDESRKKEIEMKKSIDGLTSDGRKLTREVMTHGNQYNQPDFSVRDFPAEGTVGGSSGSQKNAGGLEWQPDGNRRHSKQVAGKIQAPWMCWLLFGQSRR
jgi:hypothetical protein